MTDLYLPATPTKLKDGSWGARVASSDVREGDIVRITTCRCGSVIEYSKPTDCWHCRHDA